MRHAGLPPSLLFRQYCLLAGAAGVAALREPWAAGATLVILLLLNSFKPQGCSRMAVCALCFGLAFGYAAWREPQAPPLPPWLEQATAPAISKNGDLLPAGPIALTGRVQSCEPLPDGRLRLTLDQIRPEADPLAPAYSGSLMITYNDPVSWPSQGMEAHLTARLAQVRGPINPQTPSRDRQLADAGIFLMGSHGKSMPAPYFSGPPAWGEDAWKLLHSGFLSALRKAAGDKELAGSAWGYAPALLFNDRSLLTTTQMQRLAEAGIIHSLALSGMHLGYAAAAGCFLLWVAALCRPQIFLRLTRPQAAVLAGLPPVLLCLWLGQAPVTLIRAFFMFLFWGLLVFLRRPQVLLDGLLAALGLMLLLNPTALFDLRLQLSFTAVGVIALTLPSISLFARRLVLGSTPQKEGGKGFFRSCLLGGCVLLLLSSTIQIVLLPLTVSGFTVTPLLAPLNVPWLPVLGFFIMPLLYLGLVVAALSPDLAAPVLWLTYWPFLALDTLLALLHNHGFLPVTALPRPHPLSALGFWLLLLLLGRLFLEGVRDCFRRLRPALLWAASCLGALALIFLPPYLAAPGGDELRLTLVDVGAGQAVLLEWAHGRVLVDGGPAFPGGADAGRFITGPVVAYNALPALDLAVASHPDADHLGGLLFILEHFQVKSFAGNGQTPRPDIAVRLDAALAGAGLHEKILVRDDFLQFEGDIRLEVLWPPKDSPQKGNNASIVLRVVQHGRPLAVLCGDAETPALEELVRTTPAASLAAPVLVLPHHGSAGALCPAFYDAVNPELVLTSSKFINQWGFPTKRVRDEWLKRSVTFLDTGESGQIRIQRNGPDGTLQVDTARAMPPAAGVADPGSGLCP